MRQDDSEEANDQGTESEYRVSPLQAEGCLLSRTFVPPIKDSPVQ